MSIRETLTFLDPGFHEMKQEEFDGNIVLKDTSSTYSYLTGLFSEFTLPSEWHNFL